MLKFALMLCLFIWALFCTSCSTFSPVYYHEDYLANGCMVNAINFQKKIQDSNAQWGKILVVTYVEHNQEYCHAMCIFMSVKGQVFAWDRSGYVKISGDGKDPFDVARQIFSEVNWARYE